AATAQGEVFTSTKLATTFNMHWNTIQPVVNPSLIGFEDISIPLSSINKKRGTIEFTFVPTTETIEADGTDHYILLLKESPTAYIRLYYSYSGSKFMLYSINESGVSTIPYSSPLTPGNPVDVAVKYSPEQLELILDGNTCGAIIRPHVPSTVNQIEFGHGGILRLYGNVYYSNLNISKNLRKTNEISKRIPRNYPIDDKTTFQSSFNQKLTSYKATNTLLNEEPIKEIDPHVIIRFDDGFKGVYDYAFPIMEGYGIPGTVYMATNGVGADVMPSQVNPGHSPPLTLGELLELQDAGWLIGNHTANHIQLGTVSLNEQIMEIKTAKDWLNANGFKRGACHFAYPNGSNNADTKTALCSLNMLSAANTNAEHLPRTNSDIYQIDTYYALTRDTTPETALGWVDDAIAGNYSIGITFHDIVSNPQSAPIYDPVNFESFVDGLASKDIECCTIDSFLDMIGIV
ncbi:MAG: polysaccharide deacetylase family protein, partial [Methanobacterium sp.]